MFRDVREHVCSGCGSSVTGVAARARAARPSNPGSGDPIEPDERGAVAWAQPFPSTPPIAT